MAPIIENEYIITKKNRLYCLTRIGDVNMRLRNRMLSEWSTPSSITTTLMAIQFTIPSRTTMPGRRMSTDIYGLFRSDCGVFVLKFLQATINGGLEEAKLYFT
jgi:hypothetical protein